MTRKNDLHGLEKTISIRLSNAEYQYLNTLLKGKGDNLSRLLRRMIMLFREVTTEK